MESTQNVLAILLILGTPCLAVAGGIVAAILRMRGQQRLLELVQRERIAAIEKGLDPMPLPAGFAPVFTARQAGLRRAQGLLLGGLLSVALGAGLIVTLLLLPPQDGGDNWAVGFVPAFMGVALLIAARVVRRQADEE
jgi:hypothetical protein